MLNMFVPLLGQRRAHRLVSGFLFITAQPTLADGLSDRPEARDVTHLQGPRQRGNTAHTRNRLQLAYSLGQERVTLKRADQVQIRANATPMAASAMSQNTPP